MSTKTRQTTPQLPTQRGKVERDASTAPPAPPEHADHRVRNISLVVTTGVIDSMNANAFDGRMKNLAVYAYNEYKNPGVPPEPSFDRAWTAVLVLILIVMALNLIARWVYRRFGTEIR